MRLSVYEWTFTGDAKEPFGYTYSLQAAGSLGKNLSMYQDTFSRLRKNCFTKNFINKLN
jgi:hypothetical protein